MLLGLFFRIVFWLFLIIFVWSEWGMKMFGKAEILGAWAQGFL